MIYEFFTGSYVEVGQDGIVKFRLDTDAGTLAKVFSYQGVKNPSYVRLNQDRTVLYAVQEETPVGAVHALRVEENALVPMGALSTEGADPCYLELARDETQLLAANYTSGSLAVYRLEKDGSLSERSQLIVHQGKGPHPTRQKGPHIHCAMEHGGKIFVNDLGLDTVFIYEFDSETGKLVASDKCLTCPPGAGPRHLAFHPKDPSLLYVICELSNQVAVYRGQNGQYTLMQLVSTLPEGWSGENTAAAIKIQGSLLFASNRGHDSVAVYRIQADGLLERTQIASSVGSGPRDIELFGDYLVAANQYSGSIHVLKIDQESGTLTDAGISCSTPHPCCIQRI
jgi:6-phosphogluconolactonase